MSAIRLARGFTGRDTIVKFEGCYHGHSDSLLIKAGSGALTFGVPTSPGVPRALAAHTVTLDYNDADAGARGVPPDRRRDRLRHRRAGRRQHELRTARSRLPRDAARGMRSRRRAVDLRRGHDRLSRRPRRRAGNCTACARISRRSARSSAAACRWAPSAAGATSWSSSPRLGPVYQAGTLSGNPVAMTAGLATLELIAVPGFHERLNATTDVLVRRLAGAAASAGIALATNHVCGMFGLFFTGERTRRQFRQGDGLRCRALQALLSSHARGRRVLRAVGLRSGIPVGGALDRRHRRDDCGGGEDLRQPALRDSGRLKDAGIRLAARRAARGGLDRRQHRLSGVRARFAPRTVAVSPRIGPHRHAAARARARVAVPPSQGRQQARLRIMASAGVDSSRYRWHAVCSASPRRPWVRVSCWRRVCAS